MKRKLIITISFLVGVAVLILILVSVGFFDGLIQVCMYFWDDDEIDLGSNLSQYVKDSDIDESVVRLNRICEYNGQLYYVHPESKRLYKYNENADDTLMCDIEMEYAVLIDSYILYSIDNDLLIFSQESEQVQRISKLSKRDVLGTRLLTDKLFFINDKHKLCSYDIDTYELKRLTMREVVDFKIYGDNIFYTSNGLLAMNLDGKNKNRLTFSYVYDYDFYKDYLFLVNESMLIFRIDLHNNSYCILDIDENAHKYFVQTANDKLYYIALGESANEHVEFDINGENRRKVGVLSKRDNFSWVFEIGNNYFIVSEPYNKHAFISLYDDQNNLIKKVSSLGEVCGVFVFGSKIVVKADVDDKETLIFYDRELNEIERIS